MADPQPTSTTQQAPATTTPAQQSSDDDTLVIKALQDLGVAINGLLQTIKTAVP